jgi:hypothetical protein
VNPKLVCASAAVKAHAAVASANALTLAGAPAPGPATAAFLWASKVVDAHSALRGHVLSVEHSMHAVLRVRGTHIKKRAVGR